MCQTNIIARTKIEYTFSLWVYVPDQPASQRGHSYIAVHYVVLVLHAAQAMAGQSIYESVVWCKATLEQPQLYLFFGENYSGQAFCAMWPAFPKCERMGWESPSSTAASIWQALFASLTETLCKVWVNMLLVGQNPARLFIRFCRSRESILIGVDVADPTVRWEKSKTFLIGSNTLLASLFFQLLICWVGALLVERECKNRDSHYLTHPAMGEGSSTRRDWTIGTSGKRVVGGEIFVPGSSGYVISRSSPQSPHVQNQSISFPFVSVAVSFGVEDKSDTRVYFPRSRIASAITD